jgi:hypothetical protein
MTVLTELRGCPAQVEKLERPEMALLFPEKYMGELTLISVKAI